MKVSVNNGTVTIVMCNGKVTTLVGNDMMDLHSQDFALEVKGKHRIGIEWFGGTNQYGDCLYGFTPFGGYALYERNDCWILSSIDGEEIIVDNEEEGIRAINLDFKSRVFELLGKPFVPSDRIAGSWGSWDDESDEYEIGVCGSEE